MGHPEYFTEVPEEIVQREDIMRDFGDFGDLRDLGECWWRWLCSHRLLSQTETCCCCYLFYGPKNSTLSSHLHGPLVAAKTKGGYIVEPPPFVFLLSLELLYPVVKIEETNIS